MTNSKSNQSKLSKELVRILAEVALVGSELKHKAEEISVEKMAEKAGVSRQDMQYHVDKLKKEKNK